jgi:hypothetical protein
MKHHHANSNFLTRKNQVLMLSMYMVFIELFGLGV